jgi:hypothetical protein
LRNVLNCLAPCRKRLISGYHMALVAGVVFFVVRALLALSPVLAMRHAIKKCVPAVEKTQIFSRLLPFGYH